MINVWGTVGGVAGFIPMSALTGATGQLLGMDATATFAEWKAVTFLANQLAVPAGGVGAPSYTRTGDLTTGFYFPGAGQVALAISGVLAWLQTATLLSISTNLQLSAKQLQEATAPDVPAVNGVTDLSTLAGNYVQITNAAGIKAITGFAGATIPAGTTIETKFVITAGSLSLTHDPAAFILLGGAGLALQNGDVARWRKISSVAANWEMVGFQRGTGGGLLTTKGDLLVGLGGGNTDRLPAPPDGSVFVADSSQTRGYTTSPLPVGGSPVPQAIQRAAITTATGLNNAISAGAGLRLSLSATAVAMAFAFGSAGLQEILAADNADIIGADLRALTTSYVYRERNTAWGTTIVPPQYGYFFDQTKQALLNFEGANGAVVTTDDFGNTWTLTGATISTAQFKFGASSLRCAGAQYARSTNFTTLGDGSWELSCWFRVDAITAALQSIITAVPTGTNFGALIGLAATTGKLAIYLSSNGTSFDLVNAGVGATTIVALTWYKIRLVFDALAGTYRIYLSNNGAAEVQDYTLSSSAKIAGINGITLGADGLAAQSFAGYIDAFRFTQGAPTTFTEAPAAVAPTVVDYPVHYCSLVPRAGSSACQMFQVTAASVVAGIDPTLTAKDRVFAAEVDTGIGSISTIRNYAIRGEYTSDSPFQPVLSTITNKNHNLGVYPKVSGGDLINVTAEFGFKPGDVVHTGFTSYDGVNGRGVQHQFSRNSMTIAFSTAVPIVFNLSTGAPQSLTVANWRYRAHVRRGW